MCESALAVPKRCTSVTVDGDEDVVPSGYRSPVFVKDSDGFAKWLLW